MELMPPLGAKATSRDWLVLVFGGSPGEVETILASGAPCSERRWLLASKVKSKAPAVTTVVEGLAGGCGDCVSVIWLAPCVVPRCRRLLASVNSSASAVISVCCGVVCYLSVWAK